MPEAFAGVPALAQFGGGGGARGGGGGGSRGRRQQPRQQFRRRSTTKRRRRRRCIGGGGGGGGGGFFSVPPDETAKIDVPVVCLNHGLREPNSSAAYKMVPAGEYLEDHPAVVELLKAFGNGDLDHQAVQAAAWHLNNDMSWDELKAQLQGTKRSHNRPPYFTAEQLRNGMAYANNATRSRRSRTPTNTPRKRKPARESRQGTN